MRAARTPPRNENTLAPQLTGEFVGDVPSIHSRSPPAPRVIGIEQTIGTLWVALFTTSPNC